MAKMLKKRSRKVSTSKRQKRLKQIKPELKTLCREIILLRDEHRCQRCNEYVTGSNAHCSHIIPKSKGEALRYDLLNLLLLCFHDHIFWWHKNPLEAQDWFKNKYPARYEYLWSRKETIVKRSLEDLEQLLIELKQKKMELTDTEQKGGDA